MDYWTTTTRNGPCRTGCRPTCGTRSSPTTPSGCTGWTDPHGEARRGALSELPPGSRKVVELEGRSIGVFNVDGELFALRNRCPHQGGPLCRGALSGLTPATTPDDLRYIRRGETLRCPWHPWEFDIRTGQSWVDPAETHVRRYDATLEPGSPLLVVKPETDDSELLVAGFEKGPYVAEAYQVSVEEQYVVVSL